MLIIRYIPRHSATNFEIFYKTPKQKVSFLQKGIKTVLAASWQAKSFSTVDHVDRYIFFPIGPSFEGNPQIATKR